MQPNKNVPVEPKSEKARARFEQILDTVEAILATLPIEELGIQEVSKRTGLPPQAIYRLFPSPRALVHGLAVRYLDALKNQQADDSAELDGSWQENLKTGLAHISEFYNARPLAMSLILGSAVTSEIRAADRANVTEMAAPMIEGFGYALSGAERSEMNTRIELAIDLIDAVWSHSYFLHQEITPFFLEESCRAAISYLELYFGRYFPVVTE